ncbi:hypothetical protein [Polynucleobacter sp. AP-Latsch-80-C2]|uniref:hypothetical protein n=1 Tax=Polynucleobacter sp. AP-Latsch-80-C2 TaxID=2576931 RepID=UPI001C0B549E|nr:hypothetical protein [Polynucleobacter sp. AP-Latsch-80-C2]MBU3623630.1 hypothetical protein [Polynucleobacter sp. AP-Latsch-80-C2]
MQKRLEQLERGEALEARDINALLNDEQKQRLMKAWSEQQALRKKHKPPKTEEEQKKIGWKTIRDVRIEIYKQAIAETETNLLDGYKAELKRLEVKKARVFMDAVSLAGKEGKNMLSAGNIALARAGFGATHSSVNQRDREINAMEDALRKQLEEQASDEEKEQLAILREHEKALEKRKK